MARRGHSNAMTSKARGRKTVQVGRGGDGVQAEEPPAANHRFRTLGGLSGGWGDLVDPLGCAAGSPLCGWFRYGQGWAAIRLTLPAARASLRRPALLSWLAVRHGNALAPLPPDANRP